ncbi:hypothetical protein CHS52_24920 [Salmonella enterica subsp. enterica serovar Gatuni]|nr:hypothetical protein [Salmonella enterica]ECA7253854.1 hypothetical protein [Salmonella enterica subsp. enterica serovar Oranienburg]ECU9209790.1 hypothetical protein [Salmonella enterica subsp. enterica serovar Gatuni]EBL0670584.1 hypothetical protein [Salmonella enterica]EBL1620347.1 hypothetical protein [Salmonella enterica]
MLQVGTSRFMERFTFPFPLTGDGIAVRGAAMSTALSARVLSNNAYRKLDFIFMIFITGYM